MKYIITVPENIQAKLLFDYILSSQILDVKEYTKESEDKDNEWDSLPEHVKNGINKGLKQIENGECSPHNEVLNRIKSKYLKNESNLDSRS